MFSEALSVAGSFVSWLRVVVLLSVVIFIFVRLRMASALVGFRVRIF